MHGILVIFSTHHSPLISSLISHSCSFSKLMPSSFLLKILVDASFMPIVIWPSTGPYPYRKLILTFPASIRCQLQLIQESGSCSPPPHMLEFELALFCARLLQTSPSCSEFLSTDILSVVPKSWSPPKTE